MSPNDFRTGGLRVGVYVDVANLAMNGGFGMQYDVLRAFACRNGQEPMRLNAYVSFDAERARSDTDYRLGQNRFHSRLRDFGFKVIVKEVRWFTDDTGSRFGKSNADLDLAVDALLQSERLDRVLLATGDGDFVRLVNAMQNRGCRVEVVAFDNVAADLRREADLFLSGYLIPDLLPANRTGSSGKRWGEIGSVVRGVCYAYDTERGYGFVRYIADIEADLSRTDSRDPGSSYAVAFVHGTEIPESVDRNTLTNRNLVFEFQLAEGAEAGKTKAVAVRCIQART